MHLKNETVTAEQQPDGRQHIDLNYYRYLLEQHNHDLPNHTKKDDFESQIRMEHSYTRDRPVVSADMVSRRNIMIEEPPQCPSCQLSVTHEERFVASPDASVSRMPEYDEETGRCTMQELRRSVEACPNANSDSDDWTEQVLRFGWTKQQAALFEQIERILDLDQLARLAIEKLPNECLRQRSVTEKSASRFRQAMASVHWDRKLTQWLHSLLCTHLPPHYMTSYIAMLQSLKKRVPTLVDKLLFDQPGVELSPAYLNTIMQQPWEPNVKSKLRPLPRPSVIIVVPSTPCSTGPSPRQKRWCELLGALAQVQPIYVDLSNVAKRLQSMEHTATQLTAITRAKIQEVRKKMPEYQIILVGFGLGASVAIQAALVHKVNSVVCIGFAYNTICGSRGNADDRVLNITTPILFVVGDNAQRTSPEEIEHLRQRIPAQSSLIVVGSTDDHLRVDKTNRVLEGVTQSMVDNIIVEEIREFALVCLVDPPAPRQTVSFGSSQPFADTEPPFKRPKLDSDIFKKPSNHKHFSLARKIAKPRPSVETDAVGNILTNGNQNERVIVQNSSGRPTEASGGEEPVTKSKNANSDLELLDLGESELLNADILDMPITFAELDECIEECIVGTEQQNNNNNYDKIEVPLTKGANGVGLGASIKLNGTAKLIRLHSYDKINFDFVKSQSSYQSIQYA